MKKLQFIFYSALIICIVGCQESSITDPVLIEDEISNAVISNSRITELNLNKDPIKGEFHLNCKLDDPNPRLHNKYCIRGKIIYKHYLYTPISGTTLQHPVVILSLTYDAQLRQLDSPNVFEIEKYFKKRLELTYSSESEVEWQDVVNVKDSDLKLLCTYKVSTDGLAIRCMVLAKDK